MKSVSNTTIIYILIASIILRFFLSFTPSFDIDMTAWKAWAARLAEVGSWNFYNKDIWTNYTPGYLYFLWIIGLVFEKILHISTFSIYFEVLIKLITNLFDLAVAYLIFKIVNYHLIKKMALVASMLYLFNPAIIFNSSVWGQIDGILTFFLMLSFYLLYERKNVQFSLLSFAFSILIKPQALALTPLYLILLLNHFSFKKFLHGGILIFVLYFTTIILFFPKNILLGLPLLILQMVNDYSYTSLYAFNLWAILGWWRDDRLMWAVFSLQNWGRILYLVLLVPILLPFKRQFSFYKANLFYLATSLSILIFFLFPTRIHERYLFPFFAFFLIAAFLKKSKILIVCYILISLIHFANLWYVYFYYQFIHTNPNAIKPLLFRVLDQTYPALSIFTIIIFFVILVYYSKLYFKLKLLK